MIKSESYNFPVAHVKDLLRYSEDIQIGKDAVDNCLQHLKNVENKFQIKIDSVMKRAKRKKIMSNDVSKVLSALNIDFSMTFPDPRLTKADIKRFMGAKILKWWMSEDAVDLLRHSLEGYIRKIGEMATIYITELNRKTLNEQAIKKALSSMKKRLSIPYLDFITKIYSKEDLIKFGNIFKLSLKGTKENMTKSLYDMGISLDILLSSGSKTLDFTDLRNRMIKSDFPIPKNIQDIIKWVEKPKIKIDQIDQVDEDDEKGISEDLIEVIEEEIEKQQNEMMEAKDSKEIDDILEGEFDYSSLFNENNNLILHEILSKLVPAASLRRLNDELDLDIDLNLEKEKYLPDFIKSGISIVYFLKEVPNKHLKEILRRLKLAVSGNKKTLVERILNSVDFIDYDVSHDDIIFAIQGDEFLKERDEEKKKEELLYTKIRDYSGSLKLELLLLIESFNFKVKENDLRDKFIETGRDNLAFYGPLGGLLRDGIIMTDFLKEDKEYYVPDLLLDSLKSALAEVKNDLEKWKGAVEQLPNSSKFLLSTICSYGEVVNINEIREKFREIYRSSSTWTSARERLKERNLIVEKLDEEREEQVIYTPKKICPILSGLLKSYKDKILSEKQEQLDSQKEDQRFTIELNNFTRGERELLYMILNSGGYVEKTVLRAAFTNPPGICYSNHSFLRYISKLKQERVSNKEFLLIEEKDSDSNELVLILNISDAEDLKNSLEESLFKSNIENAFNNFPDSVKALARLIIDEGGSMLLKDLRKKYLEFYSSSTFYKAFALLEESIFSEGIHSSGDPMILIPDIYTSEIEKYFLKYPIELTTKAYEKIELEDFILNSYSSKTFRKISDSLNIFQDLEDKSILKKLLYELNLPVIPLLTEIIPKKELKTFCKDNNLPIYGTKPELLQRIFKSDLISGIKGVILEGDLDSAIEKSAQPIKKPPISEKKSSKEDWKDLFDSTLLFEAITKKVLKDDLKKKAKELNVKYGGNKMQLIREIFIMSDKNYNELIKMFVSDDVLMSLRDSLNHKGLTNSDIMKLIESGSLNGLPGKNKTFTLEDLLDVLIKPDLKKICENLNLKKGGNKKELIARIDDSLKSEVKKGLKTILRILPDWTNLINGKYDLKIPNKNAIDYLLKLIGIVEKVKTTKKVIKKSLSKKYEKNISGFIDLVEDTVKPDIYQFILDDLGLDDLKEIKSNQVSKFLQDIGVLNLTKMADSISILENKTDVKKLKILEWFGFYVETIDEISKMETLKTLDLKNRKPMASGIVDFASGNIKKGFEKSFGPEAKKLLRKLSDEIIRDNAVKGFLFEVSVSHCLNFLMPNGLNDVKAYLDYDNYQDKPAEADGRIRILIPGDDEDEIADFLYDCKAYKDGYKPVLSKNFNVYTDYIRIESKRARREGIMIKGLILFAPKFSFKKYKLEEKMNTKDFLKNKSIILFRANALLRLYEAEFYERGVLKHFPWDYVINLNNRVIEINKEDIERALTEAKRIKRRYP